MQRVAVAHDSAARLAPPGVDSARQLLPFQIRLLGEVPASPKMLPTARQREALGHETPERLGTLCGGRVDNGVRCAEGAGCGADDWAARATGPSAAPTASAHIISQRAALTIATVRSAAAVYDQEPVARGHGARCPAGRRDPPLPRGVAVVR